MPGWREIAGYEPDQRNHYEIQITDWLDESRPQDLRTWVRILVSRDRGSDLCIVQWLADPEWMPTES